MCPSITIESVKKELEKINDPELPISIVDLGLIENIKIDSINASIKIEIIPTFLGCPALEIIEKDINTNLSNSFPDVPISVNWIHSPNWSPNRITDKGKETLKTHGVSTPTCGSRNDLVQISIENPLCPNCNSKKTTLESSFGPTRCRMIYYCNNCKNTFEHMKNI